MHVHPVRANGEIVFHDDVERSVLTLA
jgi:hypothetical protein